MDEVKYCERCGWVGHVLFGNKCRNCKIKMKLLPEEFKNKYNIFNDNWAELGSKLNMICTKQEELITREEMLFRKENFVMSELKKNPLFSREEYEQQVQKQLQTNQELAEFHQNQMLERQNKNIARMQKEYDKQNCIPKCPSCGSSNVAKVGTVSRAVSVGIFGLASSKIGKTHKCNNCGSTW